MRWFWDVNIAEFCEMFRVFKDFCVFKDLKYYELCVIKVIIHVPINQELSSQTFASFAHTFESPGEVICDLGKNVCFNWIQKWL